MRDDVLPIDVRFRGSLIARGEIRKCPWPRESCHVLRHPSAIGAMTGCARRPEKFLPGFPSGGRAIPALPAWQSNRQARPKHEQADDSADGGMESTARGFHACSQDLKWHRTGSGQTLAAARSGYVYFLFSGKQRGWMHIRQPGFYKVVEICEQHKRCRNAPHYPIPRKHRLGVRMRLIVNFHQLPDRSMRIFLRSR